MGQGLADSFVEAYTQLRELDMREQANRQQIAQQAVENELRRSGLAQQQAANQEDIRWHDMQNKLGMETQARLERTADANRKLQEQRMAQAAEGMTLQQRAKAMVAAQNERESARRANPLASPDELNDAYTHAYWQFVGNLGLMNEGGPMGGKANTDIGITPPKPLPSAAQVMPKVHPGQTDTPEVAQTLGGALGQVLQPKGGLVPHKVVNVNGMLMEVPEPLGTQPSDWAKREYDLLGARVNLTNAQRTVLTAGAESQNRARDAQTRYAIARAIWQEAENKVHDSNMYFDRWYRGERIAIDKVRADAEALRAQLELQKAQGENSPAAKELKAKQTALREVATTKYAELKAAQALRQADANEYQTAQATIAYYYPPGQQAKNLSDSEMALVRAARATLLKYEMVDPTTGTNRLDHDKAETDRVNNEYYQAKDAWLTLQGLTEKVVTVNGHLEREVVANAQKSQSKPATPPQPVRGPFGTTFQSNPKTLGGPGGTLPNFFSRPMAPEISSDFAAAMRGRKTPRATTPRRPKKLGPKVYSGAGFSFHRR